MSWLDWALSAVFAALLYVVFVQQLNPGAPGSDRPLQRENADQGELLLITDQRQAEHTTSGGLMGDRVTLRSHQRPAG